MSLFFIEEAGIDEARLAIKAVREASVGVYERPAGSGNWSREALFRQTDTAMKARGWTRLVGVASDNESVLIYSNEPAANADKIDLCLAVVGDDELVIVSTSVDATALSHLVTRHANENGLKQLRVAGLTF